MRTQSICFALAIVLVCPVVSGQWLPQNNSIAGTLCAASVVSPSTGWVVGYEGDSSAVVLKTSNGGLTWTRQIVPNSCTTIRSQEFDS